MYDKDVASRSIFRAIAVFLFKRISWQAKADRVRFNKSPARCLDRFLDSRLDRLPSPVFSGAFPMIGHVHGSVPRRSILQLGLMGLGSSLIGGRTYGGDRPSPRVAKAKNVLVIFEQGGVSQMDTFDPKPEAVAEHRSPFATIDTVVPGIRFTERLSQTAKLADKLTIVRCMHQPTPGIGNSHPKGSRYVFSGEAPGGPVDMPDIGSILALRAGSACRYLPPYILIPGNSEQANESKSGFLPSGFSAFKTGGRDLSSPDWRVSNLDLIGGIDARRFRDRADLLSNLDVGLTTLGANTSRQVEAMSSFVGQALDMLSNPLTRKAFELSTESDATRDRYGRGHRGQCYLLGRKLIESGVKIVTVDVREPMTDKTPGGSNMNWDHHDFIYSKVSTAIKNGGPGAGRYGIGTWPMMGSTDQAFSALIEDMDLRGLLAETLVCFVTEFGRTPKMNERLGRDHWTSSFSFAFAGAGVPGGRVVGETDKDGGYIVSEMAYTIEDYAATIYDKLGLDRTEPLKTPDNRPINIAAKGKPIPELF
jgi:hypothetical protein